MAFESSNYDFGLSLCPDIWSMSFRTFDSLLLHPHSLISIIVKPFFGAPLSHTSSITRQIGLYSHSSCRITPGTLTEDKFLSARQNNFLASLHIDPNALDTSSLPSATTSKGKPASSSSAKASGSYDDKDLLQVALCWVELSTGAHLTFFSAKPCPLILTPSLLPYLLKEEIR